MEHTKHIARAVLLLAAAALGFVVVRHFLVPETFGAHGHYRYASVLEHRAKESKHGPVGACGACHDEQTEAKSQGAHASVSCEVCHAPLATHVRDAEQVADMLVERSNKLCGWCHERLTARPKGFPQVVFREHVAEHGEEFSDQVCLECHDVHNPSE